MSHLTGPAVKSILLLERSRKGGLVLWLEPFLFFPGATGNHYPLWRSVPADPLGGGIAEDNRAPAQSAWPKCSQGPSLLRAAELVSRLMGCSVGSLEQCRTRKRLLYSSEKWLDAPVPGAASQEAEKHSRVPKICGLPSETR